LKCRGAQKSQTGAAEAILKQIPRCANVQSEWNSGGVQLKTIMAILKNSNYKNSAGFYACINNYITEIRRRLIS
jgi:hypothetical protein